MGDTTPETESGSSRRGPNLLQVGPALTLVLIGTMAVRPIADSSFLWHIRAGSVQQESLRVIAEDPFSWSMFGAEWRTQSWLAELLYAFLERSFDGYAWVDLMVFVCGSIAVLLMGLAVYKAAPSALAVSLVLFAAFWLFAPFLRPRPVIFSFVFLAALVVAMQWRAQLLWVIVPLIWIWSTMHGSWVIGGLFIVLEWIRTGDRRVFKAGVVALLATLATAHGIGTWLVLFDFYGAGEALALLGEWGTPDFSSYLQAPFLLLVIGILLAALRQRFRARDLVVIIPFLVLGMSANRSVVPATIVLAYWASLSLPAYRLPEAKRPAPVLVMAWVGTVAIIAAPLLSADLGSFDASKFPSDEMMELSADTRHFHSDVVGGYAIFAEGPERLVYIDDRAELYGVEMFEEYLDVVEGAYEDVFAKYEFEAAIVEEEWALMDRLLRDGWVITASDGELHYMTPPQP